MSWMTMLGIVLGVIGYILVGGLTVRLFRKLLYSREEEWHYGWFRRTFFTPNERMGLLWPVVALYILLLVFWLIICNVIDFIRWVLYGFRHPPIKGVRVVFGEKRR